MLCLKSLPYQALHCDVKRNLEEEGGRASPWYMRRQGLPSAMCAYWWDGSLLSSNTKRLGPRNK